MAKSIGPMFPWFRQTTCNIQSLTCHFMIYFPFMTKIILCIQLATLCNHKISQTMGFFNKSPFGGQNSSFPKGGPIDRGRP